MVMSNEPELSAGVPTGHIRGEEAQDVVMPQKNSIVYLTFP